MYKLSPGCSVRVASPSVGWHKGRTEKLTRGGHKNHVYRENSQAVNRVDSGN